MLKDGLLMSHKSKDVAGNVMDDPVYELGCAQSNSVDPVITTDS